MPGPLPKPNARRRNAPTIPTTTLPASGYAGKKPTVPKEIRLGKAGRAWWAWAWKTPQAAAWSPGDLYALARRASLEDDVAALETIDDLDLAELLDVPETTDALRRLTEILQRMRALTGGKLAILKEARELDDRFGLTAKALAALRWKIVADVALVEDDDSDDEVAERREARRARGVG